MDFFTCLTGFAGLLFYLIIGKGDEVIQLLNLVSVIEDVVEMLGASLSFCIGYSAGKAACYVVVSNALISFGGIYLLIYAMDSSVDNVDTQIGIALCILSGILTALYGYNCCFAELAKFITAGPREVTVVGQSSDKASKGSASTADTSKAPSKLDGDRNELAKHVGSAAFNVAGATGLVPSV